MESLTFDTETSVYICNNMCAFHSLQEEIAVGYIQLIVEMGGYIPV
jgi:hypothetical protein